MSMDSPNPLVTPYPLAPTTLPTPLAQVSVDYAFDAGTTVEIPFQATYLANGLAADLTGSAVTCLIKYSARDPDAAALATYTLASGIVMANPSTGAGVVWVKPTATKPIVGRALLCYAIRVYLSTNEVYDIQVGQITLGAAVVQS